MIQIEDIYLQRTGYTGSMENLSNVISRDFNLGEYKNHKIITIGYEDFNFSLKTNKGHYFVKVFSQERTLEDCVRNVAVAEAALKHKVNVPKLYSSKEGYLHVFNIGELALRACVIDFIEGKDLFRLSYKLTEREIRFIAKQAAKINSILIKPRFIYDSWAITSFLREYKEKKSALSSEDLSLVKPLLAEYRNLRIKTLPHCFVHGDILNTNVVKDRKGLWIVDFSCSNYAPRIQELAVLACDILFDPENKKRSEHNFQIALKEYQRLVSLTARELNALPTYIKLAHAMHVLRANYEKVVDGNQTKENEHYLRLGKAGLKQMST